MATRVPASQFLIRLWPAVVLFFAAVVLKVGPSGPSLRYIDLVGYPLFGAAIGYLIVIVTNDENCFLTYLLSLPPVVVLGRISYGFYLWHYLIFHEPSIENHLIVHRTLLTLALTLAASVASYWFIERPFLRLKSIHLK